jgi:hypothetical protein
LPRGLGRGCATSDQEHNQGKQSAQRRSPTPRARTETQAHSAPLVDQSYPENQGFQIFQQTFAANTGSIIKRTSNLNTDLR